MIAFVCRADLEMTVVPIVESDTTPRMCLVMMTICVDRLSMQGQELFDIFKL